MAAAFLKVRQRILGISPLLQIIFSQATRVRQPRLPTAHYAWGSLYTPISFFADILILTSSTLPNAKVFSADAPSVARSYCPYLAGCMERS
jgi:hypothetical protein